MDSDNETFRGTMKARDLNGEPCTVIVLRRGLGHTTRVWLTVHGAWKTTLQMVDPDADHLAGLLTQAQGPQR